MTVGLGVGDSTYSHLSAVSAIYESGFVTILADIHLEKMYIYYLFYNCYLFNFISFKFIMVFTVD